MYREIAQIPAREIVKGYNAKFIHTDNMTIAFWEVEAGAVMPVHHHIHEQITYVLEGQLDMTIGGESFSLRPGMYHIIPSNTPHSAVAVMDCKVIDTFSPVREDYKSSDTAISWKLETQ